MYRLTRSLVLIVLWVSFTSQLFAQHTITKWPDNKKGAASITFDDGLVSQLSMAVPVLNFFGMKGTFFVITNTVTANNQWDSWRNVAAMGHEIGSHTVSHPYLASLSSLSAAQLQTELSDSKTIIDQQIPSQKCLTLAYPYGSENADVETTVANFYMAARKTTNNINTSPFNFMGIKANGDDQNTLATMKAWIDSAEANGYWHVSYFHSLDGIGYGGWNLTDFTSYLSYLSGKSLWNATFRDAVKFIKERDSSILSVVSSSNSQIILNLADSLDNAIYDQPLTIRSVVPASWSAVTIIQGGSAIEIVPIVENGTPVVYYKAIPNGGLISLYPATTQITSLNPAAVTVGSPNFTLRVGGVNFINGSTVRWNGSNRTTTFISATEVQAVISAGDVAIQGIASVSVRNPDGTVSAAVSFSINASSTTPVASLLSNPGFESGVSPWTFYTNTSGTFSNDAPGNGSAHAGHAVIAQAGSNIQIQQAGLVLEANTQYQLSFQAYSNTGRDFLVSLLKNTSPNTGYGLSNVFFNLTTSWASYSVQFTTTGFSGTVSDGRFMFWLAPYAAAGDQYFIDDVVLEKIVKVPLPPTITTQPSDQIVSAGQTATFRVGATGAGNLLYQWQRNGVNIAGATSAVYTTLPIAAADNGSFFTCVVSNEKSPVTSNAAMLTVIAAPIITTQPSNQAVSAGQTAIFTVVASSSTTLSYQWRKNGVNIPGATSSSFTTPATVLTDDGSTYSCVATNLGGSVTSNSATLRVTIAAPIITTQPSTQSVTVGQPATFMVAASGTAPFSYQWLKNGGIIPGATSSSYTTPATVLTDSGSAFSCVVTNPGGSLTSNSATLTVASASSSLLVNSGFESGVSPWSFYTDTSGSFNNDGTGSGSSHAGHAVIAQAGTNIQLSQSGIALEPNTQYVLSFKTYSKTGHGFRVSLFKNVSPYTNYGLNYQLSLTSSWSSYTVQFTTTGFSGTVNDGRLMFYMAPYAAAGDEYFFDDVMLAKVSTVLPPTITTQPSNQVVIAGQAATFSVTATGGGNLLYQWQRNGVNIAGATSAVFTTLPIAASDDGSLFRCVVSNEKGSVTSTAAILTVIAAPIITTQPSNQTVSAGQTATFTVVASSAATLSYQWRKNGVNIPGATSSSFMTPATVLTDDGSAYSCVATNPGGSVTSNSAVLTVVAAGGASSTSDDFNPATIEPKPTWRFYDPYDTTTAKDPGESTLSYDGATAQIAIPAGLTHDLWSDNYKSPRLLQSVGNTDFTIEAKFNSQESSQYQMQGIIVQQTNTNLLRFDATCDANGVFLFSAYLNGSSNNAFVNQRISFTPPYLKVSRSGNTWTFSYSQDGATWNVGGTFVQNISVTEVGFFAGTSTPNPAFTAIVDYYKVTSGSSFVDPPVIATQPANQSVTAGQTATFSVVATGSGTLTYQWRRNGTNIASANSASYATAPTIMADNGAIFTCVVSNSGGAVTSNPSVLTVTAIPAPVINIQPSNQSVMAGQTATFTIAVSGTAPLSYQWLKTGAIIAGATSSSYTTPATALADSGLTFTCIVTNPGGSVTSNLATLMVTVPVPVITAQPSNQSVTVGQTATFTIAASGTAPLTYQWLKTGVIISGATSSSYTTPATALTDSGSAFSCVVTNPGGSLTSNAATLTVASAASSDSSLLVNSGFESGVSSWYFYTDTSGSFNNDGTGSGSSHAGHVVIAQAGTNIQLSQSGIALEPNTQYVLSFKAYSKTGHGFRVSVFKNVSPFTNYGLNYQFNLTSSWASYTVQFTTTGFSGTVNDGRVMFYMAPYAAAGDEYFFDDVILTKK